MRSTLFAIMVVFLPVSAALPQGFSAGVKGGVNFARQQFEAGGFPASFDGRTGFHAGIFAGVAISENFSVQAEPMYSSVGSRARFGSPGDMVQKVDYISLPLLLQFRPAGIFNLHAGPQVGLIASARHEFDGDNESIKADYRKFDFGLCVGTGAELPKGFAITARYVFGLSNVDATDDTHRLINSAFQLSLSYSLYVNAGRSTVDAHPSQ